MKKMEASDLTVRVLKDIRGEIQGMRQEQLAFREEQKGYAHTAAERFEVIESTLKDLAEQLVMLGRGVNWSVG